MKDFKIKIMRDCVSETLDNTTIILNLESGFYHELNQTGTIIWSMIKDKKITRSELLKKLYSCYKDKNIEEDVDKFIENLVAKGIIHKG